MNIYIARHKLKKLTGTMPWPDIAKELGLNLETLPANVKRKRKAGLPAKYIAHLIPMPLEEVKKILTPIKKHRRTGIKMSEEAKLNIQIGFYKYVDSGRIQQRPGKGKYKGLKKRKNSNQWEVSITVNGKAKYLGSYKDEVTAAMAYNAGVDKYLGGVGYKNEIEQDYSI